MIYIITILVCLFLVWKYDFGGGTKYKDFWFYGLLVWFIAISGLQFCVGTDIVLYMEEYQFFSKQLNFKTIADFTEDKRQPGWVLLMWFCRQFTDDFLLPKIIQAVFFNVAVFSFFKRESKYVFLCIFFYAFNDYLVTNFNVLRHSIAIAFGLYAISSIKDGKHVRFALFVFLAYMFHNSALFLLVLPIVKLFRANRITLWIGLGLFAVSVFVLTKTDIQVIINSFLGFNEEGQMAEMTLSYMNSEKLGARSAGILSIRVIIPLLVVVYCIVNRRDVFWGGYGVLYVLILLLTSMMPILWRFRLYVDFPYYIMLASFVTETPLQKFRSFRHVFYVGALVLFMYFPMRQYFRENPDGRLRYIDQYYPYHSVFDPEIEERY